jgi:colicin import membrane protein
VKIDWSEPGLPLSAVGHAVVLVASLIGLSSAQPFADAEETVPVEIITADQFSAMTKGERTAKEVQPTPKPRIDEVAEVEQLKATQGTDQTDIPTPPARAPEISDATSAPPLPPTRPPDPVKPEPQKAAEPQKPEPPKTEAEIPKPPEKPQPQKPVKTPDPPKEVVEKQKPQPPQFDKIAQLLDQKKLEDPPKPAKPPAKEKAEPNFSTSAIEKLLISKEKPQATGSVGAQLQKTASLGTPTGDAPKLSPSMRDALAGLLKDQVQKCFDVPPGMDETKLQQALVHVVFKEDGSLAERPQVASASSDPGVRAVAGALQRAIMRCAPYRIPGQFLPFFEQWKDTTFRPPESFG